LNGDNAANLLGSFDTDLPGLIELTQNFEFAQKIPHALLFPRIS
jgi:hypothetical protein